MTSLFSGFSSFPTDQPTPQSPPHLMYNYAGSMSEKPNFTSTLGSSPLPANSQYKHHSNSSFNTFPTPCSSAAGTVPPTDLDHDVNMAGMSDEERGGYCNNGKRKGSMSVEDQHDLYRNHGLSAGAAKRRHSVEENLRQDSKTSSSIPLHQQLFNPGEPLPLYLFCQRTYTPLYPPPTMNVLPIYNLTSIAESVARFDPVTGAKKKLRKSYKGKIQDLSGRNEIPPKRVPPTEPVEGGEKPPQPANRSLGLLEMLDWPDDDWYAQKVAGKEIGRGISQDALRKSLSMAPGPIPGFDPAVLGLDENEPHNKAALTSFPNKNTPSASNATPHYPSQQTQLSPPHQPNGATPGGGSSASGSPADSRPKRTVRKKRWKYDDNSFEGYGEGYEDDEAAEEYGEDGTKKKKKRKKQSEFPGAIS